MYDIIDFIDVRDKLRAAIDARDKLRDELRAAIFARNFPAAIELFKKFCV